MTAPSAGRIWAQSYEEDRFTRPCRWNYTTSSNARPVAPVGCAFVGRVQCRGLRGNLLDRVVVDFVGRLLLCRGLCCHLSCGRGGCCAIVAWARRRGWSHATSWSLPGRGVRGVTARRFSTDSGLLCFSTFPFCCYWVMTTVPVVANGLSRTALEMLGNLAPLIAKFVVVGGNDILLLPRPLSSLDIWVQNITPTTGNGEKRAAKGALR